MLKSSLEFYLWSTLSPSLKTPEDERVFRVFMRADSNRCRQELYLGLNYSAECIFCNCCAGFRFFDLRKRQLPQNLLEQSSSETNSFLLEISDISSLGDILLAPIDMLIHGRQYLLRILIWRALPNWWIKFLSRTGVPRNLKRQSLALFLDIMCASWYSLARLFNWKLYFGKSYFLKFTSKKSFLLN